MSAQTETLPEALSQIVDSLEEFGKHFQSAFRMAAWRRSMNSTLYTADDYYDAVFDLTNLVDVAHVEGNVGMDGVVVVGIRGLNRFTPRFLTEYVYEGLRWRCPVNVQLMVCVLL